MPRIKSKAAPKDTSTATIGFEAKLWLAADKLRNNMDAAEYSRAERDRLPQAARRVGAGALINISSPASPAPRAKTAAWQSAKFEVRVSK